MGLFVKQSRLARLMLRFYLLMTFPSSNKSRDPSIYLNVRDENAG